MQSAKASAQKELVRANIFFSFHSFNLVDDVMSCINSLYVCKYVFDLHCIVNLYVNYTRCNNI